ncbi:MAG: dihydroorotase [Abyssibacter sp.]|uniref:dihydroorotase n=1 Tax=Abyssibacter sp. TaxID=2320200 RepID=UPI00321A934B
MSEIRCLHNVTRADGPGDELWMIDGLIAEPPASSSEVERIDTEGGWWLPLAVDLCARVREPGATHKANIATETAAAIRSGVGSLCVPPDSKPVVDQPAVVDWIADRASTAEASIHLLGALTEGLAGQALSDLDALLAAGCVGVAQPRRLPDVTLLRQALQFAAGIGCTVHLDPVDRGLAADGVAHAGRPAMRAGLTGIPASAESIGTAIALELARDTGCRIHLGRLTTARAMALVRAAKHDGVAVTCDVAVHHLFLNDQVLERLDPAYRLDPPLRTEADRQALLTAVGDGTVDAVCSDHAPQDENAKTDPYPLTEPGGSTIEQLVPAIATLAQQNSWGLGRVAELLVQAPSRILGLEAVSMTPGTPAHGVLLRPLDHHVDHQTMRSAGYGTPMQDIELQWTVAEVWRDGRMIALV